MTDQLKLNKICNSDTSIVDIVFIHGLGGSSTDTWTSSVSGKYWPRMICDAVSDASVYALDYSTGYFQKDRTDSYEKANAILDCLTSHGISSKPFIIICHSLGGIITKMIMRKSIDSSSEFHKNCRQIVFIAVPHEGSELAPAANFFSFSTDIRLVANLDGYLHDLNEQFSNFASNKDNLKVSIFYSDQDFFVKRESANIGIAGVTPIPISEDHSTICKPEGTDAQIHSSVVRGVRSLINEIQSTSAEDAVPFQSDDYTKPSDNDRRSLQEKLESANRQNEYDRFNEHQNKFAREYIRNGLSDAARIQFNDVLAEVEQRFQIHIYPLIQQNMHDPTIPSVLQKQVIDPVAQKFDEKPGFTTQTVQRAVYYLTEQCHLRWDPE